MPTNLNTDSIQSLLDHIQGARAITGQQVLPNGYDPAAIIKTSVSMAQLLALPPEPTRDPQQDMRWLYEQGLKNRAGLKKFGL